MTQRAEAASIASEPHRPAPSRADGRPSPLTQNSDAALGHADAHVSRPSLTPSLAHRAVLAVALVVGLVDRIERLAARVALLLLYPAL